MTFADFLITIIDEARVALITMAICSEGQIHVVYKDVTTLDERVNDSLGKKICVISANRDVSVCFFMLVVESVNKIIEHEFAQKGGSIW